MLHQTGVVKIAQFNAATEIYTRPALDAMVTKWLFLTENWL